MQALEEVEVFFAGHAEDPFDTLVFKSRDEQTGAVHPVEELTVGVAESA